VHFVDDVDLIATDHRQIFSRFHDLPSDFIHARFARGVHFVHVYTTANRDRATDFARVVRFHAWSILAAQSLGKKSRRRSLSGPTRPRKKIAVGDAAGADGVLERPNDVILPNQIGERLTSIFPIQGNVGHGGKRGFPVAGNGASHRESTYCCYLPVLTEFTDLLPRSSRRSTEFSRPPGATGALRHSLLAAGI